MKIINNIIQKFLLLLLFFSFTNKLTALDIEKYSVKDIFVEIKLDQNYDNRKKALSIAYDIALKRYLNWITLLSKESIKEIIVNISPELLTAGYSLENEKFTKSKYSALITVKFDKTKIINYLEQLKIKYYFGVGSKTLIIPLMKFEDRIILWDDPNPWFEAWMKRPLDSNLTEFILPVGDVEDLIILSAEDADNLAFQKIRKIAYKYDATNLILLTLNVNKDEKNFNIELEVYNGFSGDSLSLNKFKYEKNSSFEDNLYILADNFANYYDDLWVEKNINKIDLQVKITAFITFSSFSEWNKIKQLLINSDRFTTLNILRLTKNSATVKVNILSKKDLIRSLEKLNFIVLEDDLDWTITSQN